MPAAVAIPAAIGAGTSIFGGIMGSRAAGKAARTQAEAAARAAAELRDAVNKVNPELADAMREAIERVTGSSEAAATGVEGATREAQERVTGAAGEANRFLDPYARAGEGAIGTLANVAQRGFSLSDLQMDPGYEFRLQEGQKALERSAAARGTLVGGRSLKEITRYAQGVASDEYGRAYDRYTGLLKDVAGLGYGAATRSGENLMSAGRYAGDVGFEGSRAAGGLRVGAQQYAGDARMRTAQSQAENEINAARGIGEYGTQAANARAAGYIGSANAWSGAAAGIGRAAERAGDYFTLRDILKQNPALASSPRMAEAVMPYPTRRRA